MEISAVFVVLGTKRFCQKLHLKYTLFTKYIPVCVYAQTLLTTTRSETHVDVLNYDIGDIIFM